MGEEGMAKKQPLERRIAPLLEKINARPRSGLNASKAFFDDLSGQADHSGRNCHPSDANEGKAIVSLEEIERRRRAIERADAHNRLEGLRPSPEMREIIEDYIHGRIELEDILPRVKAIWTK
jgi:hypothetical protein